MCVTHQFQYLCKKRLFSLTKFEFRQQFIEIMFFVIQTKIVFAKYTRFRVLCVNMQDTDLAMGIILRYGMLLNWETTKTKVLHFNK